MCDNNNTQSIADYLAQLLKDKKQLAAFPNVFLHLERLLDDGKQSNFTFPSIVTDVNVEILFVLLEITKNLHWNLTFFEMVHESLSQGISVPSDNSPQQALQVQCTVDQKFEIHAL